MGRQRPGSGSRAGAIPARWQDATGQCHLGSCGDQCATYHSIRKSRKYARKKPWRSWELGTSIMTRSRGEQIEDEGILVMCVHVAWECCVQFQTPRREVQTCEDERMGIRPLTAGRVNAGKIGKRYRRAPHLVVFQNWVVYDRQKSSELKKFHSRVCVGLPNRQVCPRETAQDPNTRRRYSPN
jgi:hypothetical protein